MNRVFCCSLSLLVASLVLVGCDSGRELTPDEKAGNTNFMGNNPSEQPLANAPGSQQPSGVSAPGPVTETGK